MVLATRRSTCCLILILVERGLVRQVSSQHAGKGNEDFHFQPESSHAVGQTSPGCACFILLFRL